MLLALSALRDYTEPRVRAVRDGRLRVLQGWELVPGNDILLEKAKRCPRMRLFRRPMIWRSGDEHQVAT